VIAILLNPRNEPVKAMFELRNITKQFSSVTVLDNVTLEIATGQTTVLLGPSGCGKSTLLRVMLGLVRPDAGEVRFAGEHLALHCMREQRGKMGYVVQDGGLFPHFTCSQNVTLMAHQRGWPRERIEARLEQLTRLARLSPDTLGRYPVETSGGQRQRIGLMRALMLDPEALLLDEPLGALDPITRADLQMDLRAAFQTLKKTVVLVTHDLAEAAYFADTVVLLDKGRIVQRGALRDLVQRPASPFVTKFVESQRGPWEALREAIA
jgi:osmoprotectant transport system ATP-binding protein